MSQAGPRPARKHGALRDEQHETVQRNLAILAPIGNSTYGLSHRNPCPAPDQTSYRGERMRSCPCPAAGTLRFALLLLLKFFVLSGPALCIAASCNAQDKVELFGGYSYFRASIQEGQFNPCVTVCPNSTFSTSHANLNGWALSGQYKLLPFLGAVADFNGTYGTVNGGGVRQHTFLVGPQVSLPTRVSPFVHALFGAAIETQSPRNVCAAVTSITCPFTLGSDTSFATAIGAGFDLKLVPFVKLRLIQVDYLRTQLHGTTQNQPRASAGIVFHF